MMNSIEGNPISSHDEDRAQRVERLKMLVKSGNYQVNAHALADRLLAVGMIEDSPKSIVH